MKKIDETDEALAGDFPPTKQCTLQESLPIMDNALNWVILYTCPFTKINSKSENPSLVPVSRTFQ